MRRIFIIGRAMCIVLYALSIVLWIVWGLWFIFAAIALIHFCEMWIKGLRVGSQHDKSVIYSIAMTMLFGFAWWLPVDKGWM